MDFWDDCKQMITKSWAGVLSAYVVSLVAIYLGVWAVIEPLDLKINFQVSRPLCHVVVALLIASHLTIVLAAWDRRRAWRAACVMAATTTGAPSVAGAEEGVDRGTVIDRGNSIISSASRLVVLFGRDLSWVQDYRQSIAGGRGARETFVVCQKSDTLIYRTNMATLRECGARVIETKEDLGIKATLVDPDQSRCGQMLVVQKDQRNGKYFYNCKVYDHRNDEIVVNAVYKLFMSLRGTT